MTKRTRIGLINTEKFRLEFNKKHRTWGNGITRKQYSAYIDIITKTIREYVLQGGFLVLPYSIGNLYIMRKIRDSLYIYDERCEVPTKRIKPVYVDWNKTYKLRKEKYPEYTIEDWKKPENKQKCIIIYDNKHTDGYLYKIKYSKDSIKGNRPLRYYYFKPYDVFKSSLSNLLFNTKNIPTYYEPKQIYNSGLSYREFEKRLTAKHKDRQRAGYRKYLESLKENRN